MTRFKAGCPEERLTASGSVEEIVTVTTLITKTCTPCRGGMPPLTPDEVKAFGKHVPDWSVRDEARRIERAYTFKNFAEAEGHHPDIGFGWGYATVSLQTKKIKGLHENDFIMAAKIDDIADNISLSP
jgi:4a-hydroxytetrahydrobiopterin dehydratase